jgi:hypothetical protein
MIYSNSSTHLYNKTYFLISLFNLSWHWTGPHFLGKTGTLAQNNPDSVNRVRGPRVDSIISQGSFYKTCGRRGTGGSWLPD